MWVPEGRDSLEDVLWRSICHSGLEERMRSAFHVTTPLWYGLWIGSPLTVIQCSLLRDVFTETARLVPHFCKYVEDVICALADSIQTGEPLHVALAPPGHADFGLATTFVHCPQCKAEGPVKRWQEAYSEDALECPVCGYSYSPVATYSSDRILFAETVRCPSCKAEHRVRDFSDEEINILEDRHTFDDFIEELSWLRRVEAFYKRNPDLEGKIKPHFVMVLESRDPEVRNAMFEGLPFAEIELPSGQEVYLDGSRVLSKEDQEVVDYLRRDHFSLPERTKFVEDSIERLGLQLFQASPVKCTECGGNLT